MVTNENKTNSGEVEKRKEREKKEVKNNSTPENASRVAMHSKKTKTICFCGRYLIVNMQIFRFSTPLFCNLNVTC